MSHITSNIHFWFPLCLLAEWGHLEQEYTSCSSPTQANANMTTITIRSECIWPLLLLHYIHIVLFEAFVSLWQITASFRKTWPQEVLQMQLKIALMLFMTTEKHSFSWKPGTAAWQCSHFPLEMLPKFDLDRGTAHKFSKNAGITGDLSCARKSERLNEVHIVV